VVWHNITCCCFLFKIIILLHFVAKLVTLLDIEGHLSFFTPMSYTNGMLLSKGDNWFISCVIIRLCLSYYQCIYTVSPVGVFYIMSETCSLCNKCILLQIVTNYQREVTYIVLILFLIKCHLSSETMHSVLWVTYWVGELQIPANYETVSQNSLRSDYILISYSFIVLAVITCIQGNINNLTYGTN
jgi:hypothetical protein